MLEVFAKVSENVAILRGQLFRFSKSPKICFFLRFELVVFLVNL